MLNVESCKIYLLFTKFYIIEKRCKRRTTLKVLKNTIICNKVDFKITSSSRHYPQVNGHTGKNGENHEKHSTEMQGLSAWNPNPP